MSLQERLPLPMTRPRKRPARRLFLSQLRLWEALFCFLLLLALWEAVIRVFDVKPYVFPSPIAVFSSLWTGVVHGDYLYHLMITLTEVVVGFAVGSLSGLLLGIVMALVPAIDRIVYPYVVAIQTVPKVAIAPLMIIWFGFGIESKIIVVAVMCMFPVLANTIAGMRATDSDRINLVRAMCGSRLQVVGYIQLPSALPYVFAGLNTGIVLAVIGAVVGEFVGAQRGLGVLILQANFALDLASVFALLTLLSLSGVLLNLLMRAIERRVCFWSGKSTK